MSRLALILLVLTLDITSSAYQGADIAFFFVRIDSIPGLPVDVSSTLAEADMIIWSGRPEPRQIKVNISHVLQNFDGLLYAFLLIGLAMATIWLASFFDWQSMKIKPKIKFYKKRTYLNLLRKFYRFIRLIVRHILYLLLDQEHLVTKCPKTRILWLSLCWFVFFTVFGFFLNLMSTEMVAEIPRPTLDTIDDLFTEEFKDVKVFVTNVLPAHNYILSSRKDTLVQLGKQIARNDVSDVLKTSVLSLNDNMFDTGGDLIKRIQDVIKYKGSAFIVEKFVKTRGLSMVQCQFDHQFIEKSHESDTFGQGAMAIPLYSRIDSNLKSYFDQVFKSMIEFGMKEYLANRGCHKVFDTMGVHIDAFQTMKCMNPIKDKEEKDLQLKLETLGIVLKGCGVSFAISLVLHILSYFRGKLSHLEQ